MPAVSHFFRLGKSPLIVSDYMKPFWWNLNLLQRNGFYQRMLRIEIHNRKSLDQKNLFLIQLK